MALFMCGLIRPGIRYIQTLFGRPKLTGRGLLNNNDVLRVGWGWNKDRATLLFRIAGGRHNAPPALALGPPLTVVFRRRSPQELDLEVVSKRISELASRMQVACDMGFDYSPLADCLIVSSRRAGTASFEVCNAGLGTAYLSVGRAMQIEFLLRSEMELGKVLGRIEDAATAAFQGMVKERIINVGSWRQLVRGQIGEGRSRMLTTQSTMLSCQ